MNIEAGRAATRGTQTVDRALRLLKAVAASHPVGITLPDVVRDFGLDRTTAYRLMSSLVESGMLERDDRRIYRLGLEAMQLGLAAMNRSPIVDRCRPFMQRLARKTEDTVFLVIRNGDYGHCVHCEEGVYPVKTLVLQVGGMRVLGIGSAGLTLLASLSDHAIEALYAKHSEEFKPHRLGLPKLRRLVAATRRQGYSESDGLVTEGVGAVGRSFAASTTARAAVSVAAISSRMSEDRRRWIAGIIADEVREAGLSP
jgi:DNA-binding IclR family transcriptional regulator